MTVIEYDEILNNISAEPDKYMSKMLMGQTPVKTIRTKLVINRDDLFLSRGEISYYDAQGNLIIIKKTVSQPIDNAPADIYELGVPADVNIINKVPDEKVQQVRALIKEHQNHFLKNYIAVQTEVDLSEGSGRLMEAMVIYSQGEKLRVDVFRRTFGAAFDKEIPAEIDTAIQDSKAILEPYVQQEVRPRSIRIYDGLWQHELAEHEGQLVLRSPQRRPDGDEYADDDIPDFGWRLLWLLNEPEWMYEDDFSTENNLIGMEVTWQSQWGRLPERKVLYVDPSKDYLFRRYIEEKLVNAPWQIDKSWLDEAENKGQINEEVRVYDVTEYGQTTESQWYPKTITIEGYDHYNALGEHDITKKYDRVCRIYLLEENPDLPESLFNPCILSFAGSQEQDQ